MRQLTPSSVKPVAVIPAAGFAVRMLPATKTIAKEILPIGTIPAITRTLQEARAAGLTEAVIITAAEKTSLNNYFAPDQDLVNALAKRGLPTDYASPEYLSAGLDIEFVNQEVRLGLGHAVAQAKKQVENRPLAVLLPDVFFTGEDQLLTTMLATWQVTGSSVIALNNVPRAQISSYGCAEIAQQITGKELQNIAQLAGRPATDQVFYLNSLVEKPDPAVAPSTWASTGRFILNPQVFAILENLAPGVGGEIQLTDALNILATQPVQAGGGVTGVVTAGRHFDTGSWLGYWQAVVTMALEEGPQGHALKAWLQDMFR